MAVIDASVYVSTLLPSDANHRAAQAWIGRALRAGERISAPWILVAEVASAIGRSTGDTALAIQVVQRLMRAGVVQLVQVGPALAEQAALISAQRGIRGCDAIYVALAASLNDTLVTFDKQQGERAMGTVAVHQPT